MTSDPGHLYKIGVINYGSGNYKSVCNALDFLGIERTEILQAADFAGIDHIILPGVGAYGNCMERLRAMNIIEQLKHDVGFHKKFFLGICIGMQVLVDIGTENTRAEGLGLIGGTTEIIKAQPNVKVPNVGWSDVKVKMPSVLFENMEDDPTFYFIHSYHVVPDDPKHVCATIVHGHEIVASIENENIFGVQFHPEKSQKNGLQLLTNFAHLSRN